MRLKCSRQEVKIPKANICSMHSHVDLMINDLTSFQVLWDEWGLHKKRLPLLTEKQDASETDFTGWTKVVNINEGATVRKTGRPLKKP